MLSSGRGLDKGNCSKARPLLLRSSVLAGGWGGLEEKKVKTIIAQLKKHQGGAQYKVLGAQWKEYLQGSPPFAPHPDYMRSPHHMFLLYPLPFLSFMAFMKSVMDSGFAEVMSISPDRLWVPWCRRPCLSCSHLYSHSWHGAGTQKDPVNK